ncbi:MAG: thiamine phosphate synthase [Huintestinicola sp.]
MLNVICVTDRKLCRDSFLAQLVKICAGGIDRVILREKDLDEYSYEALGAEAVKICRQYHVPLSMHTYVNAAEELGADSIHLPYEAFMADKTVVNRFETVGVSVHSLEEALGAEKCGAAYITAGHIFQTDCKKGIPPRGVEFLREICGGVVLPVYAIGGITPENVSEVKEAGADGVCVMSSLMTSADPSALIADLKAG